MFDTLMPLDEEGQAAGTKAVERQESLVGPPQT
jgi:hypothetical protein